MVRPRTLPIALVLLACHNTQLAQTCPTPATTPAGLLVTQILLRRGVEAAPEYTLSLTASGDALYVGAASLPVPGAYMGRVSPSAFQQIAADLIARGLAADTSATRACAPQPAISVAVQTADGHYSGTVFCGRSEAEGRYAGPIYRAIEQIRWYPGARTLAISPG